MAMEFAVRLLALAFLESVFGAPAEARALAQPHHGCDSVGRVALMPNHIGHKLEAQLEADIKRSGSQADGCNNCRHAGWSAVWAAPGDVCDLQAHMAHPTIHFYHCSEDGYAQAYALEDHVKLCLKKEEVDWLWNHGPHGQEEGTHCQTKEGQPHLGPEGLLVCEYSPILDGPTLPPLPACGPSSVQQGDFWIGTAPFCQVKQVSNVPQAPRRPPLSTPVLG
jgi:hypothetical protein